MPDLANGRVLFVTGVGHAAYDWQLTLHAFDSQTTRELWSVPFAPAQGGATRLISLDTNGVAFTTDAGLLFVVRSDQLSNPGADLQVTQAFTPNVVPSGANSVSAITVLNLGPATATGVLLSNQVPADVAIKAVTTSKGTILQTNPAVLVRMDSLTNGEAAIVSLNCLATNQGLYLSRASVTADQPDPNPANSTATANVQIVAPLLLTISDAAAREGNVGLSGISFNMSLSSTASVPVSVRYQTADGTALAGLDYNTNAGLLTIPAGTLTRVLTLNSAIRGNTVVQSNRFFFVNLSAATNATLSRIQAVATILDDDYRTIAVSNIALVEGNTGTTNAVFNFSLTPASTTPVAVDYQTLDGSAAAGSDYAAHAGTLVFSPGVTNLSLAIPVFGDTLPEMDETFSLLMSQPSGAILAVNNARATIINDDPLPPVEFSSITWNGQLLRLRFATIEGRNYRVERTTGLNPPSWSILTNNVTGIGSMMEVTDSAATERSASFYRLVLLP